MVSRIKKICNSAFRDCISLKNVALPSTISVIGCYAFNGCMKLRTVDLPKGIQLVDSRAFIHCSSLERITFQDLSVQIQALPLVVQAEIELKTNQTDGVTMRAGKVFISPAAIQEVGAFDSRMTQAVKLRRTARLIDYCDVREITTILKLAFWKATIEESDQCNRSREECRVITTILELAFWEATTEEGINQSIRSREECRVMSGADAAVEGVLQFLS